MALFTRDSLACIRCDRAVVSVRVRVFVLAALVLAAAADDSLLTLESDAGAIKFGTALDAALTRSGPSELTVTSTLVASTLVAGSTDVGASLAQLSQDVATLYAGGGGGGAAAGIDPTALSTTMLVMRWSGAISTTSYSLEGLSVDLRRSCGPHASSFQLVGATSSSVAITKTGVYRVGVFGAECTATNNECGIEINSDVRGRIGLEERFVASGARLGFQTMHVVGLTAGELLSFADRTPDLPSAQLQVTANFRAYIELLDPALGYEVLSFRHDGSAGASGQRLHNFVVDAAGSTPNATEFFSFASDPLIQVLQTDSLVTMGYQSLRCQSPATTDCGVSLLAADGSYRTHVQSQGDQNPWMSAFYTERFSAAQDSFAYWASTVAHYTAVAQLPQEMLWAVKLPVATSMQIARVSDSESTTVLYSAIQDWVPSPWRSPDADGWSEVFRSGIRVYQPGLFRVGVASIRCMGTSILPMCGFTILVNGIEVHRELASPKGNSWTNAVIVVPMFAGDTVSVAPFFPDSYDPVDQPKTHLYVEKLV